MGPLQILLQHYISGILSDPSVCQQPLTPDLATSPLWDMDIRQEVVNTKQTDFQIHNLKSELLVPGKYKLKLQVKLILSTIQDLNELEP